MSLVYEEFDDLFEVSDRHDSERDSSIYGGDDADAGSDDLWAATTFSRTASDNFLFDDTDALFCTGGKSLSSSLALRSTGHCNQDRNGRSIRPVFLSASRPQQPAKGTPTSNGACQENTTNAAKESAPRVVTNWAALFPKPERTSDDDDDDDDNDGDIDDDYCCGSEGIAMLGQTLDSLESHDAFPSLKVRAPPQQQGSGLQQRALKRTPKSKKLRFKPLSLAPHLSFSTTEFHEEADAEERRFHEQLTCCKRNAAPATPTTCSSTAGAHDSHLFVDRSADEQQRVIEVFEDRLYNKKRGGMALRQHKSTFHKKNFNRAECRMVRRLRKKKVVNFRFHGLVSESHLLSHHAIAMPASMHKSPGQPLLASAPYSNPRNYLYAYGGSRHSRDAHFVDVIPYNGGVFDGVDKAVALSTVQAQTSLQGSTTAPPDPLPTAAATRSSVRNTGHALTPLEKLLVELQYRDATPEDYQLLLQLDDSVAPKTLGKEDVSTLADTSLAAILADTAPETPMPPKPPTAEGLEVNGETFVLSEPEPCPTTAVGAAKEEEQHSLPQEPLSATVHNCSICLDEITLESKVKRLPCGHFFHSDCIEAWLLEYSTVCPLDNLPIG